jgi:hypothetical protein
MFQESAVLEEPPVSIGPDGPTSNRNFTETSPRKNRRLLKLGILLLLAAVAAALLLIRSPSRPAAPATAPWLVDAAAPTTPDAVATGASAPLQTVTTLAMVFDEVKSITDDFRQMMGQQSRLDAKIDQLSQDLATLATAIKETNAAKEKKQAAAAVNPARHAAARHAKAIQAAAAASALQVRPTLLAVDVWDNQPSVVIGNTEDKRVRFLNPADSVAGVSVVSANPGAQTATVQVGERTVTLQREQ